MAIDKALNQAPLGLDAMGVDMGPPKPQNPSEYNFEFRILRD